MFSDQITPLFCQGIVAIVCPGFSELMRKTDLRWMMTIHGIALRKGKVDDVSGHLCEH